MLRDSHDRPLLLTNYDFQPVVAFAGEHCHPSFYSTVHGAYLSGRSAAQFMLNAAAKSKEADDDEDVYNLGAASVADLSTWLQASDLRSRRDWYFPLYVVYYTV